MTEFPENIHNCAADEDMDWENRKLCSDDSCIGTVGADGCCRLCGRVCTDIPEDDFGRRPSDTPEVEFISTDTVDTQQSTDPGSSWENRRLCSDDSCIGTIGADGHCNVCGLSAPDC